MVVGFDGVEVYWVNLITGLSLKLRWPKISTNNKNVSSYFTQFHYL